MIFSIKDHIDKSIYQMVSYQDSSLIQMKISQAGLRIYDKTLAQKFEEIFTPVYIANFRVLMAISMVLLSALLVTFFIDHDPFPK